MYKSPYKISIWDTSTSPESKLFDIGSDTMESLARAIEPKLVRNINGKKSFSFKMYKTFIDENGTHDNPYIPYLINERLVKVYWDDEWYDFVIKNVQIDSAAKVYTVQCEDWCVQELSKQGFNLEFDEKLENNQGTAIELAQKVLENTNWSVDEEHSSIGYEYNKEAVYEVQFTNTAFTAQQLPSFTDATIQGGRGLIFFSCVQGLPQTGGQALIQFVWTGADSFETEQGSMLVVDSDQHNYQVLTNYTYSNGTYTFTAGTSEFAVNFTYGTSTTYRAKRLVNSLMTVYDAVLDKYCHLIKSETSDALYTTNSTEQLYITVNNQLFPIYLVQQNTGNSLREYKDTEYNFAKYVQNLIANGSSFVNSSGWRKVNSAGMEDLVPKIEPAAVKSYLQIPVATGEDWIFNLSIRTSSKFVENFIYNEHYYVRVKFDEPQSVLDFPFSNVQIAEYISSDNYMIKTDGTQYFTSEGADWVSEGDNWYRLQLTCINGLSLNSLIDSQVGLFFQCGTAVNIEEIQLFKEVFDSQDQLIYPGEFDSSGVQKEVYKVYDPETDPQTKDDIAPIYEGLIPFVNAQEGYAYVTTQFQKIRTINARESNRFNILQSIAEKFEIWCVLVPEHDESGVITSRKIKFVETVGEDKNIGFIYGLDLKGVKRTIDSKEIVTKTIVKPNSNKYATNGFCTIARAQENFPKTNFVFNFDYYVNQGLLDNEALNQALNSVTSGSEGYYVKLNEYNTAYDAAADKLEEYQLQYDQLSSYLKVFKEYDANAESQKYTGILNLFNLGNFVTSTDKSSLIALWNQRDDLGTPIQEWYAAHVESNTSGQLKDATDRSAWKYNEAVTRAIEMETKYDDQINNIEVAVADLETKINALKATMEELIENINDADLEFAQQYGQFIQEGTWSSEEYMSDTLYYLDALDVAYTSARPRVTYAIDVLRLRALPGYELRKFNLGDISYVEDTEFFGYTTINGIKTPFHEQVVLTELTESFDDPSKDQFKVQNYRTQFEDLFQRITASTQSLQWNEADYGRAVSAVQKDQTINTDILQGTFNMAQNLVRSSLNNAVTQDATGITIVNQDDPSKQSHIVAEGFFISTDGGVNWRNAVSAEGVATELLTAGAIDTNRISIKDGTWEAFRWDSSGLNAYRTLSNGTNNVEYGTFVRFDKWGIYGVNGKLTAWTPSSENDIITDGNVKFSLTWSGLNIKSVNNNYNFAIGDFASNKFGIRLAPANDLEHPIFQVDDSGQVTVTGSIVITSGSTYNDIHTAMENASAAQTAAGQAAQAAQDASDAAAAASTKAGNANYQEQTIYKSYDTTAHAEADTAPETWVENATGNQNVWTIKRPVLNSSYPILYTAVQRRTVAESSGSACSVTNPRQDDTITVISGGSITTGKLTVASGGYEYFSIDQDNKRVKIAGFNVNQNSIMTTSGWGTQGTVMMCTGTSSSKSIGGSGSISGWAFTAGSTFGVTNQGALYATSAHITGDIIANSLTLGSGASISAGNVTGLAEVATTGNYNLLENKPDLTQYATNDSLEVYVQKDGTIGSTPAPGATGFLVSRAGLLTCSNAIIWGTIYASAGQIGGLTLENGSLHYGNLGDTDSVWVSPGVTAGSSVSIAGSPGSLTWAFTASNTFGVTTSGALYTNSGTIAGWGISAYRIGNANTYLDSRNNEFAFHTNNNSTYTSIGHNGDIDTSGVIKVQGTGIILAPSSTISVQLSNDNIRPIIKTLHNVSVYFGIDHPNSAHIVSIVNDPYLYIRTAGMSGTINSYKIYVDNNGYVRATSENS